MKLLHYFSLRKVALLGTVGLFSLSAYALICPTKGPAVFAETATTDVEVEVQPIVSIALGSPTVAFNVVQNEAGAFNSNSTTVTVSTNNASGYSLYLYTQNGATTLTGSEPTNSNVINAISTDETGITASAFGANTWGYNLSAGTSAATAETLYLAVPAATGTVAESTEAPTSGDTYTLTFGANVNNDLPADTYSNDVVVSIVANPKIATLSQITNMQEMTAEICSASAEGETAQLIDTRDGSDYSVAKLPDGNCWMTQNLRLSGGRTLTSSDSNVASSWTLPSTELAGNSYSYTDPQTTISSNTSYGGYYNYCAASAGTNCQTSSTYDTTYDICPKGWRLPTLDEMSGITSYSSAFSPVLSGRYDGGSLYNTGSLGYWWSATAYNSSNQYNLAYNGSSLYTIDVYTKRYGYSVRCIRSS